MTPTLKYNAPAKINLYLHVTGKREDGYHLLDSVTVFAKDIADIITITPAGRFSLSITGEFADGLGREDLEQNLAVRAAKLFCDVTKTPLSFSLHLEKNIPMGAGLGGGSADAAAVIHALEDLYAISLPDRTRHLLSLGADVPVCYHGSPCRFEGVGDVISAIPLLPSMHILLVWPHHHSPTKDVFARRDSRFTKPVEIPERIETGADLIRFLRLTGNDLAPAAKLLSPVIREAEHFLAQQNGCLLSRMSGSGSSVFGLFKTAPEALEAGEKIGAAHPTWWVRTSQI